MGGGQQLVGGVLGQVRSQRDHGTQVQPALGHGGEDGGEPACRARRVDALAGSLLGEMQLVHAVQEHRGESSRHVEPACIDLDNVGQRHCSLAALPGDVGSQTAKEIVIAEVGK